MKIFKHLGNNPFSGHMHYQCPSCEMVLLVDPVSVLGNGSISPITSQGKRARRGEKRRVSVSGRVISSPLSTLEGDDEKSAHVGYQQPDQSKELSFVYPKGKFHYQ